MKNKLETSIQIDHIHYPFMKYRKYEILRDQYFSIINGVHGNTILFFSYRIEREREREGERERERLKDR